MKQPRGVRAGSPRLVLCTCDSWYGAQVLAILLASEQVQVTGIVRSARVLSPRFGFARGALEQVRISGFVYSAYLWCITTGAEIACPIGGLASVGRLVSAHVIPSLVTRNVNDAEGQAFIARAAPDVLISAFFNQRLAEPVLALPTLACINIHPSLLPAFRGVDPVFYTLLRGVRRFGVSVHRMAPELDSGNLLEQEEVGIADSASVFEITARLFRRGAELSIALLDRIEAEEPGVTQRGEGNYDSWPTPSQVRTFRDQGHALIRLSDIARLLHGETYTAIQPTPPHS